MLRPVGGFYSLSWIENCREEEEVEDDEGGQVKKMVVA